MVTEFHGFTRITKPSPVEEYESMIAKLATIDRKRNGRYSLESLALMHWAFMMFINLVDSNNPLVKEKLKYFSCTELVELAACIGHPEAVAEYFSPLRRVTLGGELDYFLMHAQHPKADHQFQIKEDLRFDVEQRPKVLQQIRDYLWCKKASATGSLASR